MLYEIINPSDPYHFEAHDLEVAAICIAILGKGMYGATPLDDKGEILEDEMTIPMFMFGADDWFMKQFGVTFTVSMDRVMKDRKLDLMHALESVTLGSFKDRMFVVDALNSIDDPVKKELFKKKWLDEKRTSLNNIGGRADSLVKSLIKNTSTT